MIHNPLRYYEDFSSATYINGNTEAILFSCFASKFFLVKLLYLNVVDRFVQISLLLKNSDFFFYCSGEGKNQVSVKYESFRRSCHLDTIVMHASF